MSGGANSNRKRCGTEIIEPRVKICIKSQDGNKAYYRVPRDKRILNLLMTYCTEKNFDYNAMVFLYDGRRIKATSTADELGMENEDEIDAMFPQTGGGCIG